MAYIVTKACLGTKDKSCCEVCPVDCFYDIRRKNLNDTFGVVIAGADGEEAVGMLMIHPDECINCAACETECPVEAIYEDSSVPEDLVDYIKLAQETLESLSDADLDKCRCTSK